MFYRNTSRFPAPDVALLTTNTIAVDTLYLASILTKRNKMSTKDIGYV